MVVSYPEGLFMAAAKRSGRVTAEPSQRTISPSLTLYPGLMVSFPFTVTIPSRISVSQFLLLAIPERAMYLLSLIPSAWGGTERFFLSLETK